MKTSVIIPTYNEADNIETLVVKIIKLKITKLTVIIVDDASSDGTGELADTLARKLKGRVRVVHRKKKLGLGTAYVAGWKEAKKISSEVIVTMDADFSHDPAVIPAMIDGIRHNADVVIGSRNVAGGQIIGVVYWRYLLSRLAQILCKNILRLHIYDSTSGFRAYRMKAFSGIKPETIKSEGYSYLIEVIYRCNKAGYRIEEVPIIFRNRVAGKSKISDKEIYNAALTILSLIFSK